MAFEHDAEYAILSRGELTRDILTDFDLLLRIFARVSMAEINHQTLRETRLSERLGCGIDARRIVIRRLAAAQDDMAILVAGGPHDRRMPALRHRQEMMRRLRRADRIDDLTLPSVPFLGPTGLDSRASSR
jgi:hypothetical protein